MKDILQQIQQLKEDFMNLKEVDDVGLGQPASDTPPSTNKIKRNVKTKNGKAELVSVEDELFPYDGNKREQYRQKIIDTVNGMIQGTATLDDLLQVVRSQKNMKPVKEGFEGTLRNEIRNRGRNEVGNEVGNEVRNEIRNRVRNKLKEALEILEGLCVNDGHKDLLWNDTLGRGGSPISAASNALAKRINRMGTQRRV